MPVRTVELTRDPITLRQSLTVDGHRMTGVTGVTVTQRVGRRDHVEVSLVVHEVQYFGVANVVVPEKTHDSLVALGWTPPARTNERLAAVEPLADPIQQPIPHESAATSG